MLATSNEPKDIMQCFAPNIHDGDTPDIFMGVDELTNP